MKKKKKEKKIVFVYLKDQKLIPKIRSVIPMKIKVRKPKIGLETRMVYAAE
jgi:hypothetical protein